MIVYNYDPITKEYTYQSTAQQNPRVEGAYLIPANATITKPLKNKKGFVNVWQGNKWAYMQDHRGEEWYNSLTKNKEVINFIGELSENYYTLDSVIANPPEGEYWQYDKELDKWVGNPVLYKLEILNSFDTYWNIKLNQPFEFEGYKYIPAWRELYTSIWITLRDGIRQQYRLQDVDGNFNTVDVNNMKRIISKMADVVDNMYIDKQNLEGYFKSINDFEKLETTFKQWLEKTYD